MGLNVINYALAKKKITSALSGVKEIKLDGPRTIVFTTNDGSDFRITIPVPDLIWIGDTAPTDPMYELWIDTSDQGTTPINRAILSEDITSGISIGSVVPGSQFKVGDSLEDVIRSMLTIKTKPKVSIATSLSKNIYDITTEEIDKFTITGNITPGSSKIASVKFYVDEKLVNTVKDKPDGGVIKYENVFQTLQKKTFTVKVEATDLEGQTGSSMTTINFVAPSFYGMIEDGVEFNEDSIKALQNKELKTAKTLTYDGITSPSANKAYRITYCYPASFGAITSVTDAMNFEYIQDYIVSNITMDEIDYIVMHEKDAGYVADYLQKFK